MRSRPGRTIRLKASPDQLRAAGVLLAESAASATMDLPAIFGNRRPVEVEIGVGKGAFLLGRAKARPEVNVLGIEWLRGYAHYAADRAARASLTNVRLLCADAEQVVSRCLAETSVWRVHIYFPDPWPKRKHRRRRLIKPDFAGHLRRVLLPGGTVHVVTDHAEYFGQISRVLKTTPGFALARFSCPAHSGSGSGTGAELVGTNFERKYLARGRRFSAITVLRYG